MIIRFCGIGLYRLLQVLERGRPTSPRFDYAQIVVNLGERESVRDYAERLGRAIDVPAVIGSESEKEVRFCGVLV